MIEANTPLLRLVRTYWPLVMLSVGLLVIVAIVDATGDVILAQTLIEGLVRVVIVAALYLFIGNSGIISFGHIGFVMIGAYATAWQTCCPYTVSYTHLTLPTILLV